MSELSAWILSIGAFAGVIVCTVIAARAIAGDPARGRRRCPKCWHEFGPSAERTASLQCPECGHLARSEADLARNRRSVARAVLATVGVIAIVLAAQSRLLTRGAWSMAPTSVLLAATPVLSGGGYRSAAWELAQRVQSGEASDPQVRAAFAMFIEGDEGARPPSPAWRAKYRDIGTATRARLGPNDPLMKRLLEIPPAFEVAFAEGTLREPAAAPLVFVDAEVWWPAGHEGRLDITFADGSRTRAAFRPDGRYPVLTAELPVGSKEGDDVVLALSVGAIGAGDDARAWTAYPRSTVKVPSLGTVPARNWRAVERADLSAAVQAVYDEGLIVWSEGGPRAGLRFDHRRTAGEEFAETAIGLRVEVLEDGVVRRTSRMWWLGGARGTAPRWLPSVEDSDAMARLFSGNEESDRRWSLRIRGDESLARYAVTPDAGAAAEDPVTAWFEGTIEMPLRVERADAPAPVRRWKLVEPSK